MRVGWLFPLGIWVVLLLFLSSTPAFSSVEYTIDGAQEGIEEEIRWLVNRARFNRQLENALRGTSYSDIPSHGGPLAPHQSLTRSARRHSEDMARRNRFQHGTLSNSFFYNPASHPEPWDRMEFEGYDWYQAGENIAAGYATANSVFVGWWRSTGHRRALASSDFAEIGNGYFYGSTSTYGTYFTMDLGSVGNRWLFTDTLFLDSDQNGRYNEGEGIDGVRVELFIAGQPHTYHDISTSVGSFAIPIQSIPIGGEVNVRLVNPTAQAVTLTVPRDYAHIDTLQIPANSLRAWGSFVRTSNARNYGFRDSPPPADFLTLAETEREHSAAASLGHEVAVESNVVWQAESLTPWITLENPSSGERAGVIRYQLETNPTGDPRSGSLRVFSSEMELTLTLLQRGQPPVFNVDTAPRRYEAPSSSEDSLSIDANLIWIVSSNVPWVQIRGTSTGSGNGSVEFHVSPNPGSTAREGFISVQGGSEVRRIAISQDAGRVWNLAQEIDLDLSGGEGTVIRAWRLPLGWFFDPLTGTVRGSARRSGTFSVQTQIRDETGQVRNQTVTMIIQPLPAHAVGTFEAIIAPHSTVFNGLGGRVKVTVSRLGVLSGQILLAEGSIPLRGRVKHEEPGAPTFEQIRRLPGGGTGRIFLQFEEESDFSGFIEVEGEPISLSGWQRVWQASSQPVPAVMAARIHVRVGLDSAWENDVTTPQGDGFAVCRVSAGGLIRSAGRTGEGTAWTHSSFLGPVGEMGLWCPLQSRRSSFTLQGQVAETGQVSGSGLWLKKAFAGRGENPYPNGYGFDERGPVQLIIDGSPWIRAQHLSGLREAFGLVEEWPELLLGFGPSSLESMIGLLPQTSTLLDDFNRITVREPSTIHPSKLRLRADSGLFTGTFRRTIRTPEGGEIYATARMFGLLIPHRQRVVGTFVAPHQQAGSPGLAGRVQLFPLAEGE